MMQKTTLLGYIGNEPKIRYTQAGTPVTSFSVATSKRRTDPSGHKIETTTWWQVSAWNQLAEIVEKYGYKGQKIYIEGEIQSDATTGAPRLWVDKQTGQLRASFELKAFQVRFLSWKDDKRQGVIHVGQRGHYNGSGGPPAPAQPAAQPATQAATHPATQPATQAARTTLPYRPPANQWRQNNRQAGSNQRRPQPASQPASQPANQPANQQMQNEWDYPPNEIPF